MISVRFTLEEVVSSFDSVCNCHLQIPRCKMKSGIREDIITAITEAVMELSREHLLKE